MSGWRLADKVLSAPIDESDLGGLDEGLARPPESPARVELEPRTAERSLARLVLGVVELLRQLLERQAIRRVEAGHLDDAVIERLGETLLRLDRRMQELKAAFGLTDADLRVVLDTLDDSLAPGRPDRPASGKPEA